jgi:hypothetical protein
LELSEAPSSAGWQPAALARRLELWQGVAAARYMTGTSAIITMCITTEGNF